MIYYLGIAVLTAYISASSAMPPCLCTRDLKPVCGSDGVTYNNECLLECRRTQDQPSLTVVRRGSCRVPRTNSCICSLEYKPVCGSDGRTYSNSCSLKCMARSTYVSKVHEGACKTKRDTVLVARLDPCVCTKERTPVCGTDGHTYSNRCLLRCARQAYKDLDIKHVGRCVQSEVPEVPKVPEVPQSTPPCTCTRSYEPVCGSDGQTYSNLCMMKCAGEHLTLQRHGSCDGSI